MSNYRSTRIGFRNVTNPEPMPQLPTPREQVLTKAEDTVRVIIAGAENGAIRRIILYLVTGTLLVTPFAPVAVVPLVLLLATDDLK